MRSTGGEKTIGLFYSFAKEYPNQLTYFSPFRLFYKQFICFSFLCEASGEKIIGLFYSFAKEYPNQLAYFSPFRLFYKQFICFSSFREASGEKTLDCFIASQKNIRISLPISLLFVCFTNNLYVFLLYAKHLERK